ncbi:hypothetical protein SUDANB66_06494 (plasmid) [Streptomyces sp. SudanB66_2053]
MGDPVPKVDKHGQQPVDEPQPVLCAGAHGPLPRSGGKPRLVTLLPQGAALLDEFNKHSCRQAHDPPITARVEFPTT